jgi:putative ABC transport system ATP-binding protein
MGTSGRSAGELSRYELRGVSLRFESRGRGADRAETLALNGVSLDVAPGELAVVMGASGSGKSTLLHVLAGLATPDRGTVTFRRDNESPVDLAKATEDERARIRGRHIGFVYQAFNLIPTMTAAENVALPLLFRGVAPADRAAKAEAMLRQVGLLKHGARSPSGLSGGEQQRVAIARALVFDPVVLLADEPTGSLDSKSSGDVLGVFREFHESRGLTIVLVTHDNTVANSLGGRVIRMRDGEVLR